MKNYASAMVLAVLAGCASLAATNNDLQALVGFDIEQAIHAFGPAYQRSESAVGSVLSWHASAEGGAAVATLPGGVAMSELPQTSCVVTVHADKANRITAVEATGTSQLCGAFGNSLRRRPPGKA